MFGLDLKEKNVFEVHAKAGNPFLGTERMQRKAISDIYPIIREDISVFFESRTFNERTPPHEFLDQILKWFSMTTTNDWYFCEQDGRYYIVMQHIMDEDVDFTGFDADFMPTLKEIDDNFYRAMCFALKCLGEMDVELWDSEWEQRAIDYFENCEEADGAEKDEIKRVLHCYRCGPAKKVLDDIRLVTGTKDRWIRRALRLETYELKSLELLKAFIIQAIALSKRGEKISDFYTGQRINDFYSEDALPPFTWIRVSWDRQDKLYQEYVCSDLDTLANECSLAPMVQYIWSEHKNSLYSTLSDFPSEIIRVMKIGEKATDNFYEDVRGNRIAQVINNKQLQAYPVACAV